MVRSIIYTLTAIAMCAVLFVFTDYYLGKQFGDFYDACDALYGKIEDGTANINDVLAVKSLWENKKSHLHIFIPHNDVASVELTVNELTGLVYAGEYALALSKADVLKGAAKSLPASYTLRLENIF